MKTKLLFIIGTLDGGGAEKVLITILNNIDFNIYDIDLCVCSKSGIFFKDLPSEVNVIALYNRRGSIVNRIEDRIYMHFRIAFFDSCRIRRKVRKRYDSIISFLEGKPLRMHSYIYKRTSNNISWIHTDLLLNHNTVGSKLSAEDEVSAYSKMNNLVFVSNDALKQFRERFTVNAVHHVIYNPIDRLDILAKSNDVVTSKTAFTICSVGSLIDIKAFDRIIRVAKRLKDENYNLNFWIIGDGLLREELVQYSKRMGVDNILTFWGFKKPPYSFMKIADVFLLTSKAEGFSLVLCEALCLGLPIVSTKCTGPIELLENDTYGILTDHTDESIYTGLKKLIDDEVLLNQYKAMSVKRSGIFDINRTMNEIYSLFNKI